MDSLKFCPLLKKLWLHPQRVLNQKYDGIRTQQPFMRADFLLSSIEKLVLVGFVYLSEVAWLIDSLLEMKEKCLSYSRRLCSKGMVTLKSIRRPTNKPRLLARGRA